MHLQFRPMPLTKRARPFNHSDWLFELKYDGFRALAYFERGKCELVSRNGNVFASFSDLGASLASEIPDAMNTVVDGEIVSLDRKGRPRFNDLLFRRGQPCFFALQSARFARRSN
jgi:bifunctional non-homologous end joining protein LigD